LAQLRVWFRQARARDVVVAIGCAFFTGDVGSVAGEGYQIGGDAMKWENKTLFLIGVFRVRPLPYGRGSTTSLADSR